MIEVECEGCGKTIVPLIKNCTPNPYPQVWHNLRPNDRQYYARTFAFCKECGKWLGWL